MDMVARVTIMVWLLSTMPMMPLKAPSAMHSTMARIMAGTTPRVPSLSSLATRTADTDI